MPVVLRDRSNPETKKFSLRAKNSRDKKKFLVVFVGANVKRAVQVQKSFRSLRSRKMGMENALAAVNSGVEVTSKNANFTEQNR